MDAAVTPTRKVLIKLDEIRTSFNETDGRLIDRPTRTIRLTDVIKLLAAGRAAYEQDKDAVGFAVFLAKWPEACPVTSAQLAGVALAAEDGAALGDVWEGVFGAYLRLLEQKWAELKATDLRVRDRILAGLRRCAVTVRPGTDGVVRLRALTRQDLQQNESFLLLLRRVMNLLLGDGNGPAPTMLRLVPPAEPLPRDFGDTGAAIRDAKYTTNLTFVPVHERDAVQYMIMRVTTRLTRPDGQPLELPGTVWPLTIPLPNGSARYELITDDNRVVRAERLGDVVDRPLPAWYPRPVSIKEGKDALQRRFALGGVGDRLPADNRPAKAWSLAELGQVASAFERIPAGDLEALKGTSLIRDMPVDPIAAGRHGGEAHVSTGGLDLIGPKPVEPTPHVHYFDLAFDDMTRAASGPPGDCGPGGDWTLLHEIGHVVTMCPHEQASLSLARLRDKPRQAYDLLDQRLRASLANADNRLIQAFNTWTTAYGAYTDANDDFVPVANETWAALRETVPPNVRDVIATFAKAQAAAVAQADPTLAAARTLDALLPEGQRDVVKVTTVLLLRHTYIAGLAAPGLLLARFAAYAAQVGYQSCTPYGRTSTKEFFAETYALFTSDRERLWAANWRMCAWLEDGYPPVEGYMPRVR
ncbi:hypothetical protein [Nonomuraea sp. NPDC049028]|uniref:hypothetical protein n=1 Tax=Nonomuraea sp. NPDC049028 TaxID=3364348 RepID=UPI00371D4F88